MGLQPKIEKKGPLVKTCAKCGQSFGSAGFIRTKSPFYTDGVAPFCSMCTDDFLGAEPRWENVDLLCQYLNIPFVPAEWQKIWEINPVGAFARYAEIFQGAEYDHLGWGDYYNEFKALKESDEIENEIPGLSEEKRRLQKERWGHNYDDEELGYLDRLYQGLLTTQNVNGALSTDQAYKICKISLEIDKCIRDGTAFDKLLASYDKLIKAADFTPKNVKNLNDFDTCGELIKWLEKKGWKNRFYDGVTRDIVDETIKNFQSFNQRLYTNESGIGDEITARIENLKSVKNLETADSYYGTNKNYDLDTYENDGYEQLLKDEEFEADLDGDDNEY